jgi:hypothetical protein
VFARSAAALSERRGRSELFRLALAVLQFFHQRVPNPLASNQSHVIAYSGGLYFTAPNPRRA